jgi:3-phenylpropionate/cinnamic acid dioxygenase small subunit
VSAATDRTDAALQHALEQFYYREARLLDNREYRQWLALVSVDISYCVPSRVNVQVDNRARGEESMLGVERELETAGSMGCPLREETYVHLSLRVERAYKINSWAENPPARTRRIIGNVELLEAAGDSYRVLSNFLLYYARPGSANALYSGQRRDQLRLVDGDFRLAGREVVLDYADIALPTAGLLF